MKPILAAALVAAVVCAAGAAGAAGYSQDSDTLKVNVALVNVPFTVTDRHGRFVSGLTARDFTIKEDGRHQDIRNFARENELPLTMAVLIDTSPSVRPVFDDEKTTAKAFLEAILRPKDLALVIGFFRSVTLFQDYTDSIPLLERAIDDLEIGGGTSIYDAVYLACKDELQGEAGRKAVILISDGEDTTSKVKFKEALMAAQQSESVIYAISNSVDGGGFVFGRRRPIGYGGDIGTLKRFSEETGGRTFTADNKKSFEKVFEQIAQELRSQYSLGYYSTNTARDGKFRRIEIVPRNSSYTVRARKGYYAPKGPVTE